MGYGLIQAASYNSKMNVDILEQAVAPKNKNQLSRGVVQETYAVTTNPDRIDVLVAYLEEYLQSATGPQAFGADLENAQLDTHFTQAMDILERMGRDRVGGKTAQDQVDKHSGLAFIINDTGHLIAVNAFTNRLFCGAQTLDDVAIEPDVQAKMSAWIAKQTTSFETGYILVHGFIGDKAEKRHLFIRPIELTLTDIHPAYSQHYFIATTIDMDLPKTSIEQIKTTCNLSTSETDIVMQLVKGHTTDVIARMRNVSIHTVRKQVKIAQKKIGANGTPDMVRIVCNLIAQMNKASPDDDTDYRKNYAPMARFGELKLRDGRKLSYFEQGHPSGRPVLFINASMIDASMVPDAVKACTLKGWRVITPSRPAHGNSDPYKAKNTQDLASTIATDMAELLDHLRITQALVIGSTIGQKMSIMYPNRVRGLLCVSHVPHWDNNFIENVPTRYKGLIKTSVLAPKAVPFLVRIGIALMDLGRVRVFLDALNHDCEADIEAMKDPAIYDNLVAGLRHTGRQGGKAITDDMEMLLADWLEESKQLDIPVRVLHGRQDKLVTPAFIAPFMEAVPHAKLTWVEGAGKYLFQSHFHEVLAQLNDLDKAAR